MKTLIALSALLTLTIPAIAATCNPNGTCRACTTCGYCKNCAQKGGSCSVCRKRTAEPKPKPGVKPKKEK